MQKNTRHKPESIQKMRLAHLGMRWTEEAKRKNSEAHKKIWARLKGLKPTQQVEVKVQPETKSVTKPSFSRLVFSIKNK